MLKKKLLSLTMVAMLVGSFGTSSTTHAAGGFDFNMNGAFAAVAVVSSAATVVAGGLVYLATHSENPLVQHGSRAILAVAAATAAYGYGKFKRS